MTDRAHGGTDRGTERDRMVALQLESRGIHDPDVLRAMRAVPRDRFVPEEARQRAYQDGALAIGEGQTISQPFIVARTTEALGIPAWQRRHPDEPAAVLDVGTGSGYQAAVLSELGAQVTAIELNERLAEGARERLRSLGYPIEVVVGDGSEGYPPNAPYAGIVVAAAAPDVPPPLVEQLADGGTLVIPIGDRFGQMLTAIRRAGEHFRREALEPVVFVPLLGRYGFG